MADAAKVGSIDAIREFREALGNFIDDARNALTSVEMENRRLNEWVKNTQRLYWINEVKRRREKMNEIRGELHRRKLSGAGDTEAKEAVRIANIRLRRAEEKFEIVKKAAPILQHAIDEYLGLARPLGDMLSGELEHCMGLLERMSEALEDYIRISSPANSTKE
jgi:hypothetical protein